SCAPSTVRCGVVASSAATAPGVMAISATASAYPYLPLPRMHSPWSASTWRQTCHSPAAGAMLRRPVAAAAAAGGVRSALPARTALQRRGMVRHVLADEAGDEVVAVVIAGLHAQGQRMARRVGRGLQQLRAQLALEELVVAALVHQQRQLLAGLAQQLAGVPLAPRRAVLAQVGGKGLLAPRHLAGRDDRRERRDAAVA